MKQVYSVVSHCAHLKGKYKNHAAIEAQHDQVTHSAQYSHTEHRACNV